MMAAGTAGQAPVALRAAASVMVLLLLAGTGSAFKIIGHRGGFLGSIPEHSSAAYWLAAEHGAEYLEQDVLVSKDNVLMVWHDRQLQFATNVAAVYPTRSARKSYTDEDGNSFVATGWWIEDFTLLELKSLRLVSRATNGTGTFDYVYSMMTLDEAFQLATRLTAFYGRPIGVYPEIKDPVFFRSIGMPIEKPLLDSLARWGFLAKVTQNGADHYNALALHAVRLYLFFSGYLDSPTCPILGHGSRG